MRPFSTHSLSLVASVLLLAAVTADDMPLCCLCEYCSGPLPDRAGLLVEDGGVTCTDISLTMSNPGVTPKVGTTQCSLWKNKYRSKCCDPTTYVQDVPQTPTVAPVPNIPQGNEPWCDICFGGTYPGKPFTITTVAYIPGNPTCQDLYWMGRTGNIPAALCYPVQLSLQGPCGCNQAASNPNPAPAPYPTAPKPSAPAPKPTAPAPQPTLSGPAVPERKERPRASKEDLKLSDGRVRGSTGVRLLKGSTSSSDEQES